MSMMKVRNWPAKSVSNRSVSALTKGRHQTCIQGARDASHVGPKACDNSAEYVLYYAAMRMNVSIFSIFILLGDWKSHCAPSWLRHSAVKELQQLLRSSLFLIVLQLPPASDSHSEAITRFSKVGGESRFSDCREQGHRADQAKETIETIASPGLLVPPRPTPFSLCSLDQGRLTSRS